MKKNILVLFISLTIFGCMPDGFKEEAGQKFTDQHFKTAISLIELHKIREGEYPISLDSLKYIGDWDKMIFQSVKYKKLDDGYKLDVKDGPFGKAEKTKYPEKFWKGLGLKKSNLLIN